MPYQKIVQINSKSLNTASYCSPLKMFDYLASSNIILASDLKVYKHILKNRINLLDLGSSPGGCCGWAGRIQGMCDQSTEGVGAEKN